MKARDDGNDFPDSESDFKSDGSVYAPHEHVFRRYFRPLPNVLIRLIRRDPADPINPLVYVRDLQLSYFSNEDILFEALEALKRAGSRLERLELRFVILSEKLLDGLEPLVLATTSLTLKHCRMDSYLRDRLLALFSGRLKVLEFCADWASDWPFDSDLVSAIVEANTGSLKSVKYYLRKGMLPDTTHIASLAKADPEACFDRTVDLIMPSTAGQKSTIEEVYFVCVWHDSIPSQFARCREIADQALQRTNGIVQLDLPQTMAASLSAVIEDIYGDWTRQYESQFRT
ncbi:hypothetical protein HK405_013849 [Cladochytrium tenue]|nr:hypothetical protein HK405_013849 [Cladochytrium tenue]